MHIDVTQEADNERMAAEIVSAFGRLDVFVTSVEVGSGRIIVVAFLATDEASFITSSILAVDDGSLAKGR